MRHAREGTRTYLPYLITYLITYYVNINSLPDIWWKKKGRFSRCDQNLRQPRCINSEGRSVSNSVGFVGGPKFTTIGVCWAGQVPSSGDQGVSGVSGVISELERIVVDIKKAFASGKECQGEFLNILSNFWKIDYEVCMFQRIFNWKQRLKNITYRY